MACVTIIKLYKEKDHECVIAMQRLILHEHRHIKSSDDNIIYLFVSPYESKVSRQQLSHALSRT